ncbi:MAG: membrane protein insertion efficiency factor YidD [Magnetococcales bacterium]|nr:membrane protein insertion efficiency factor YidD [Magnetococcales bacterium]
MRSLLIRLIRRYQDAGGGRRLSVQCNYNPSCSNYALISLERHGLLRGSLLAMKRILRCRDRQRITPIDDFPP